MTCPELWDFIKMTRESFLEGEEPFSLREATDVFPEEAPAVFPEEASLNLRVAMNNFPGEEVLNLREATDNVPSEEEALHSEEGAPSDQHKREDVALEMPAPALVVEMPAPVVEANQLARVVHTPIVEADQIARVVHTPAVHTPAVSPSGSQKEMFSDAIIRACEQRPIPLAAIVKDPEMVRRMVKLGHESQITRQMAWVAVNYDPEYLFMLPIRLREDVSLLCHAVRIEPELFGRALQTCATGPKRMLISKAYQDRMN